MKVLLLENIDQFATDYFLSFGYAVKAYKQAFTEDELKGAIKNVDILGIRSKTKVTRDVLERSKKLKAIGAFCIGTDQIDLSACQEKGIAVVNAPVSNTRSVAELALGEIIMLSRGIFDKSLKMHGGIWEKSAKGSFEIRGKKLGIIGYGNIGSQLSVLAEMVGMNVQFYDTTDKLPYGNAKRCETLKELLQTSDVITIHIDGRRENINFISMQEFEQMKRGVFFLNLSRGKVVDIDALAENIKRGHIAGAAIDVFLHEPAKNGVGFVTPLQNLPNVILTPHVAGSTEEAQTHIARVVSKKLHEHISKENQIVDVKNPQDDSPPEELIQPRSI